MVNSIDEDRFAPALRLTRDVLSVSVLGGISIAFNGREVRIRNRKSRALVAFLALAEGGRETRERLVGLFWSESEEGKARASLRQCLRELRRAFLDVGCRELSTERLDVKLDPSGLDVDLRAIIRESEAHRAHPLLLQRQRLADGLLGNYDDVDPSFRVWLMAKRQTVRDRLLRGLENGLRNSAVERSARKLLAEAIVSLEPTHEEACRSLMQAKAEEGDVASALRVYKTLWDLLDDEYGMEPSAKTQELVADIKQGRLEPLLLRVRTLCEAPSREDIADIAAEHQEASLSASEPLSSKIAVLLNPFRITRIGREMAHLVHGFRHHLIASMIRVREWSVIDGSTLSTVPTKSSRYTVDATAYRARHAVKLLLTIRDDVAGCYVWGDAVELAKEICFEAQQRIVHRLMASMSPKAGHQQTVDPLICAADYAALSAGVERAPSSVN